MDRSVLKEKKVSELRDLAKTLGVERISQYKKDELIDAIIDQIDLNQRANLEGEAKKQEEASKRPERKEKNDDQEERLNQDGTLTVEGILDVMADGFGFIRHHMYESGDDDVYVSPVQVRRFKLKTGDYIKGLVKPNNDKDKFPPLIYVLAINGKSPENAYKRLNFEDLTPIYPLEKLNLEKNNQSISNRMIDLVAPVGKGQRGLIVSPPKAGKTSILKSIANAIEENHPDVKVFILLIDERPEEVTDMERSVNKNVKGKDPMDYTEVIASTFDEPVENHIKVSEIILERAKRFVEMGRDVVILLDSITRMARAYNIVTPASGRTLSGGLDPVSLYKPKRFFGAARNIENGGSLTILGTCLVDTGSRMDDMIYEEFKGTGNMELHLDRELAELRMYPAIDIFKSGTRKENLLLSKEELDLMYKVRKSNKDSRNIESTGQFIKLMKNTKSNKEFAKYFENMK